MLDAPCPGVSIPEILAAQNVGIGTGEGVTTDGGVYPAAPGPFVYAVVDEAAMKQNRALETWFGRQSATVSNGKLFVVGRKRTNSTSSSSSTAGAVVPPLQQPPVEPLPDREEKEQH